MKVIPLTPYGSSRINVDMGSSGLYTFVTKFNYTALCWEIDVIDAAGSPVLSGLMLVPDVNILNPYPLVAEKIGALYLLENHLGDYQIQDKLGTDTFLVWESIEEMGAAA